MRIVFMGANRTGWLCLKELLDMGEKVVGIFTLPRQFEISYANEPVRIARPASFEDLASRGNIPVVIVEDKMKNYRNPFMAMRPDIVFVSGWYYLIPSDWLGIPPLGFIGFHPSLLPRYRGGAPLSWAIINGETETGMTFFYLAKGVDNGNIVSQQRVEIDKIDTIATLYPKINQATLKMMRQIVPLIKEGKAPSTPQDESQATLFPQRRPEDGIIDWSKTSQQIYDWVRAQTRPYPGAFTFYKEEKLTVWSSRILGERQRAADSEPCGTILRKVPGQGLEIATGSGSLWITEVEWRGHSIRAEEMDCAAGCRFEGPEDSARAVISKDRTDNL